MDIIMAINVVSTEVYKLNLMEKSVVGERIFFKRIIGDVYIITDPMTMTMKMT
jgi:hypothetical protein